MDLEILADQILDYLNCDKISDKLTFIEKRCLTGIAGYLRGNFSFIEIFNLMKLNPKSYSNRHMHISSHLNAIAEKFSISRDITELKFGSQIHRLNLFIKGNLKYKDL